MHSEWTGNEHEISRKEVKKKEHTINKTAKNIEFDVLRFGGLNKLILLKSGAVLGIELLGNRTREIAFHWLRSFSSVIPRRKYFLDMCSLCAARNSSGVLPTSFW